MLEKLGRLGYKAIISVFARDDSPFRNAGLDLQVKIY